MNKRLPNDIVKYLYMDATINWCSEKSRCRILNIMSIVSFSTSRPLGESQKIGNA